MTDWQFAAINFWYSSSLSIASDSPILFSLLPIPTTTTSTYYRPTTTDFITIYKDENKMD